MTVNIIRFTEINRKDLISIILIRYSVLTD